MSIDSDLRDPEVRETSAAPTTVEGIGRTPRPIHPPRWLAPVSIVLMVVVAAIIGVYVLRSDDEPTTTTNTASEPWIGPEEQAFIDSRVGPLGRGTATATPATAAPAVVVHERPQGIAGMIEFYELEYIQAKTPFALAPSPASVGFPPLIGPEEQAFIDSRVGPLGRGTLTAAPPAPAVVIHQRPQGIAGMIEFYELEYIQAKTPFALAPSPASVGFPPLIGPEEQAFIDGEYFNTAVEDWCLTNRPC